MTHRGPFQPLPFCDSVILRQWSRLPREVVDAPSLELLKVMLEGPLRDLV